MYRTVNAAYESANMKIGCRATLPQLVHVTNSKHWSPADRAREKSIRLLAGTETAVRRQKLAVFR